MNDSNEIVRLIMPVIKRLPIIFLIFVGTVFVASRAVRYISPVYESTVKIKIDISDEGMANSNLFEDFDVFSAKSTIETEIEVIKSKILIGKVIDKLPEFVTSYWREGDLRKQELFRETPFIVESVIKDEKFYDRQFLLNVVAQDSFNLSVMIKGKMNFLGGNFDEIIETDYFDFKIIHNVEKAHLKLIDKYSFKVHSKDNLVSQIRGNIDIKAVSKDVDVIRASYKNHIPEKAASFLNTLAQTYIDDFITNKGETASRTISFVDKQLEIVSIKLRKAELALEAYKLKNNIVDTRQETASDLAKLSQLKIQMTNLEMEEAVLNNLDEMVNNDKDFTEVALSFDAFKGALFTELIKELQYLQSNRRELLLKYRPSNQKIQNIDIKIRGTKNYIIESIANARENIEIKRKKIDAAVKYAENELADLPTKEKNIVVLRRKFALLEANYNFLAQKRVEASILEEANIALHRVIEYAVPPKAPISPNKTLIMAVSGFLSIVLSLVFIFLRIFLQAQINSKEQLEKYTEVPIVAVFEKIKENIIKQPVDVQIAETFNRLLSNLQLHSLLRKGDVVTITSAIEQEGKSFVVYHLAELLGKMGWKVLVIDFDLNIKKSGSNFKFVGAFGLTNYFKGQQALNELINDTDIENVQMISTGRIQKSAPPLINYDDFFSEVEKIRSNYDVVIYDSSGTITSNEAVFLMHRSNLNLYLVGANHTKSHYLNHSDILKDEYDIKNLHLVLNGVTGSVNYSGYSINRKIDWRESKIYMMKKFSFLFSKLKRRAK